MGAQRLWEAKEEGSQPGAAPLVQDEDQGSPPPCKSPALEQFFDPILRFLFHLSDQAVHAPKGSMDIWSLRGQVQATESFKFLAFMSMQEQEEQEEVYGSTVLECCLSGNFLVL
ncbi:hypothetical protein HGM15179_020452 [Zosterops borbonicus]|uniref:Uncharacterized protein n=1 Tax=Zosterops borbonicus TaxID=364589 RepID=A0A8K1D6A4_9PASS|nr:hypothetical protein HGM15179_020452 [Zosterops borbonicus]